MYLGSRWRVLVVSDNYFMIIDLWLLSVSVMTFILNKSVRVPCHAALDLGPRRPCCTLSSLTSCSLSSPTFHP